MPFGVIMIVIVTNCWAVLSTGTIGPLRLLVSDCLRLFWWSCSVALWLASYLEANSSADLVLLYSLLPTAMLLLLYGLSRVDGLATMRPSSLVFVSCMLKLSFHLSAPPVRAL